MILNEPLKALSWREPYGSLMLPPHRKVETRTWPTKYRGLVLMCASKVSYPWDAVHRISGKEQFERILTILAPSEENGSSNPYCDYHGYAFAVGRLVDCKKFSHWSLQASIGDIQNQTFVEYHPELYAHFYRDVTPIKPLLWKGSQGFSNVPQEFIDKIEWL